VVAVVALALVVVGVIALRGTLSSKKPTHSPTPASTRNAAQQTPSTPVLLIRIVREPCSVFVKNSSNNDVLQSDNSPVPQGATLRFSQAPLLVQISDPACVDVFVHGKSQPRGKAQPWIFAVPS
jgi:hypothetical protein